MTDRSSPTLFEIAEETINLVAGAVTALLPLFVLSAPIMFPLAVFGGVVAAVLGLVAAVLALPVLLLARLVHRTRRRSAPA